MAKTTLKIVERKTTLSRDAIRGAFAVARATGSKSNGRPNKASKSDIETRKKS